MKIKQGFSDVRASFLASILKQIYLKGLKSKIITAFREAIIRWLSWIIKEKINF